MLRLVQVSAPKRVQEDETLAADYRALEQCRIARRPLIRACLGFGALILMSLLLKAVSWWEGLLGLAVCLAPPTALAAAGALQRDRLLGRLDVVRGARRP